MSRMLLKVTGDYPEKQDRCFEHSSPFDATAYQNTNAY